MKNQPVLKIKDLKKIIDLQLENMPSFGEYDVKVLVREKAVSYGARPSAEIVTAYFGFDHESGLILITREAIQKIKQINEASKKSI